MKETRKIVSVLLLAALYTFIIGTANISYASTSNFNTASSTHDTKVSVVSFNLFSHATEAETSFYSVNYFSEADFDSSGTGFSALLRKSEKLLESTYTQYIRSSKNRLVSYRKEDLIFPFHYYW